MSVERTDQKDRSVTTGIDHNRKRSPRLALIALMAVSLLATETFLAAWSEPAFAKGGGNGGGNGGGGGGGGGGGNGGGGGGGGSGGNSGGGGNSNAGGGNSNAGSGNSNAGGNGKSNAGGNGKGANPANSGSTPETQVEDTNSVLGLREAGLIRPLEDVYKTAEEQLDGRVLDAKLVGNVNQGWDYDLRVVTEDGVVHQARYDAATLALRTLDGQPVE